MRSMMILIAVCLASGLAAAQTGSGSAAPTAAAGSAATGSAAGSAAAGSAAGSATTAGELAGDPYKTPEAQAFKMQPPEPTPEELRKICADAMNKNPMFAESIVKTINEDTYLQHARAADAVKKNEKHVVMAYAAMWILAAVFLLFLWRRQQSLKSEIANLKRDLEAATK